MSSNNYYRIYVEDAVKLARTTVIKFDDAAYQSNKKLIDQHGQGAVDLANPRSYKYYKNLAGIPHVTDTPVRIISLDTLEEIDFTKENLAHHDMTRKEYRFGTRYYDELLAHYPDSEDLILGVLYAPPDSARFIDSAIAAENGTILYYPPEYVEANEYTFRGDLQLWVSTFLDRWCNEQYMIIDDLYSAYCIGMLYVYMVPAILTIRKRNCKTALAHSYHVREYLRSHGMLDKYIRLLNSRQALFLYKNILYIERHAGKRDTFSWLVENIMTARGLPMYEYTMRHDTTPLDENLDGSNPINYLPDVFFRRKALNVPDSSKIVDGRSTHQMLTRINPDNPGNERYHIDNEKEIDDSFRHSPSNIVRTKIVESIADDVADICPYSLEFILTQHLFHYTNVNLYNARVEFILPGMKKPMLIGSRDGTVLLIYLWHSVTQENPTTIPVMNLSRILREHAPTTEELRSRTTPKHTTDAVLDYLRETSVQYPTTNLGSVEAFYNHCKAIHSSALAHYVLESSATNETTAGEINVVRNNYYQDCVNDYGEKSDYASWIGDLGIDFSSYKKIDFFEAAQTMLLALTGLNAYAAVSIKEVQRAMVEIMKTLCSYAVHFSSDVNSPQRERSPSRALGVVSDVTISKEQAYIELPILGVVDEVEESNDVIRVTMDEPGGEFDSFVHDTIWSPASLEMGVLDFHASSEGGSHSNLEAWVEIPIIGTMTDYDELALFNQLTMTQKNRIPTIWSSMI